MAVARQDPARPRTAERTSREPPVLAAAAAGPPAAGACPVAKRAREHLTPDWLLPEIRAERFRSEGDAGEIAACYRRSIRGMGASTPRAFPGPARRIRIPRCRH